MKVSLVRSRRARWFAVTALASGLLLAMSSTAFANVALKVVSNDPYTDTNAYHATQVESDTFSNGNTIVSAFQSGRFSDGGADNIGYGFTTNGGVRWNRGFLPSTTVWATPPGPFQRATDPAVTFDAKHNTWMIVYLGSLSSFGFTGNSVS